MTKDKFAELRKKDYPLFSIPKPYSFDLNEDMIDILRKEFAVEDIASKFMALIKGKTTPEIENIGKEIFESYGQKLIKRTLQLGDEYPDRTIEVIMEAVDRSGKQFLIWPHAAQRYIEIAYLSTQNILKLPIVLNNQYELAYKVPQCLLFRTIKEKNNSDVANIMTCKHACLKILDTAIHYLGMAAIISMTKSNAVDGYCEFSARKI